jgi:hypothetical protein
MYSGRYGREMNVQWKVWKRDESIGGRYGREMNVQWKVRKRHECTVEGMEER